MIKISVVCENHGEIEIDRTIGISVECCPMCGTVVVDQTGKTIPQLDIEYQ